MKGRFVSTKSLFRTSLLAAMLGIGIVSYAQPSPAMGSPLWQLAKVKDQLNLNTSQQVQWDNLAALAKAAHQTTHANSVQFKTAMQAELTKPEPDLASMAATGDTVRQQNETQRKAVRDAWLALYATFTPEQKAIVAGTLKEGMEHRQAHHMKHGASPPAD